MVQQELVRFPARLQPEIHKDLVKYIEQEGGSINTAINNLLSFALKYALSGENKLLDETLTDFKTNLLKIKFIVDEFLIDDAIDSFAKENNQYYLDYVSERFVELDHSKQKLVTELLHALINK